MSEEKLDASVPVCVEMVPTVMEVGVTPGALVAAPAAAGPAETVAAPALSIAPMRAIETIARCPSLILMTSPYAAANPHALSLLRTAVLAPQNRCSVDAIRAVQAQNRRRVPPRGRSWRPHTARSQPVLQDAAQPRLAER